MLNLHNQIQEDWTLLRNKLEIDILQKNAHDNQFYIFILFCKKLCTLFYILSLEKKKKDDLFSSVMQQSCRLILTLLICNTSV